MSQSQDSAETAILEQIVDRRRRCRDKVWQELSAATLRHGRQRIFFDGVWLPRECLDRVATRLNWLQLRNFIELHVVLIAALLFGLAFFRLFAFLFMP